MTDSRTSLLVVAALACASVSGRAGEMAGHAIEIDPQTYLGTNFPDAAVSRQPTGITVRTGQVVDGAVYTVQYGFQVAAAGPYRLSVRTSRSLRARSHFSYRIDGGALAETVQRRLVGRNDADRIGRDSVTLASGDHQLELVFQPHQQVRVMNRVTEDYEGHHLPIEAIRWQPTAPETAATAERSPVAAVPMLRQGDRILFLGDSITDEELFPAHVRRILAKTSADAGLILLNAGISLNRAVDCVERVARDVLPLRPDWVVLCLGVNDTMQMSPPVFAADFEQILVQLKDAGCRVLCVTPPGFIPARFKDQGTYAQTQDRTRALDYSAAQISTEVMRLAAKYDALCADAKGIFAHCDLPRDRLMANQWHPGQEGARLIALAILRQWELSAASANRTGQALDGIYFDILAHVQPVAHPQYREPERTRGVEAHFPIVAASSYTDNTVSFFDAVDGARAATVPVHYHPLGLAFSRRRNELYVACEGAARIDVIDLASFAVSRSLAFDDDLYPVDIDLGNDDTDRAWVAGYYGSGVFRVNLLTGAVEQPIPLGTVVQSVHVLPDDGIVLAGAAKGVAVIDLSSGDVRDWLPVAFAGAFLPLANGRLGIVETVYWRMHVLDVSTLALTGQEPVPYPTRGLGRLQPAADTWVGDCENHRLLRLRPNGDVVPLSGTVRFPFGVLPIPGQDSPMP